MQAQAMRLKIAPIPGSEPNANISLYALLSDLEKCVGTLPDASNASRIGGAKIAPIMKQNERMPATLCGPKKPTIANTRDRNIPRVRRLVNLHLRRMNSKMMMPASTNIKSMDEKKITTAEPNTSWIKTPMNTLPRVSSLFRLLHDCVQSA